MVLWISLGIEFEVEAVRVILSWSFIVTLVSVGMSS